MVKRDSLFWSIALAVKLGHKNNNNAQKDDVCMSTHTLIQIKLNNSKENDNNHNRYGKTENI